MNINLQQSPDCTWFRMPSELATCLEIEIRRLENFTFPMVIDEHTTVIGYQRLLLNSFRKPTIFNKELLRADKKITVENSIHQVSNNIFFYFYSYFQQSLLQSFVAEYFLTFNVFKYWEEWRLYRTYKTEFCNSQNLCLQYLKANQWNLHHR